MRIIEINGHRLEMYASIEELPITRFQDFNRLMLIDAGIGSDLDAVDRHLAAVLRYNARGDKEKLQKEVMNLRQNLAFAIGHISPEMGAFCALIKSIDGEPVDDLSDEGIARTLKKLSARGATFGHLVQWMKELKKKWTASWRYSFRLWPTAGRFGSTTP